MLVTVNNRLKFEIEIVHDLSCHPIQTEINILHVNERRRRVETRRHYGDTERLVKTGKYLYVYLLR